MTRGEHQAPDPGSIPHSAAQRRAFDVVREEVAAMRQRAHVLSDASGHWWHYFCPVCGRRGQAAKDKGLITARALEHDGTHDG